MASGLGDSIGRRPAADDGGQVNGSDGREGSTGMTRPPSGGVGARWERIGTGQGTRDRASRMRRADGPAVNAAPTAGFGAVDRRARGIRCSAPGRMVADAHRPARPLNGLRRHRQPGRVDGRRLRRRVCTWWRSPITTTPAAGQPRWPPGRRTSAVIRGAEFSTLARTGGAAGERAPARVPVRSGPPGDRHRAGPAAARNDCTAGWRSWSGWSRPGSRSPPSR